jgi:hypothetical protein
MERKGVAKILTNKERIRKEDGQEGGRGRYDGRKEAVGIIIGMGGHWAGWEEG